MEILHTRQPALDFFTKYVKNADQLEGKIIYDLSSGSGYISNLFHESGANIQIYDLFPDQNIFCSQKCEFIDLQKPFPIPNNVADIVICSETIEHLPNQFSFFEEVSRILKSKGILILTTPNTSSLRSRFSQFIGESEHYNNPLPDEGNAYTRYPDQKEGYFSKLFISGILRLRTLAAINRLKIIKIHKTKSSSTSWLLIIFYPIIYYFSYKNYKKNLRLRPENNEIIKEVFKLNTSFKVLLSRHLIIEFVKGGEL